MIKQAILSGTKRGHKVQPMKDGRVFVTGKMAFYQAKELAEEGRIKFTSISEKARGNEGFIYQAICVIKQDFAND